MNRGKFALKHKEDFLKMRNAEIDKFETKNYIIKTIPTTDKGCCIDCDLRYGCIKIKNPCRKGIIKIIKKGV